jgi:hypothetical protein
LEDLWSPEGNTAANHSFSGGKEKGYVAKNMRVYPRYAMLCKPYLKLRSSKWFKFLVLSLK